MFSAEELRILKNQNTFFERIGRFMFETHPYRYSRFVVEPSLLQPCRLKPSFFQMAPIMDTIEDLLSAMLQDLTNPQIINQSLLSEYQATFTRAANLYNRIFIELGMPKHIRQSMGNIPSFLSSYLSNLVEFLRYSRDPFYVLRVCDVVLRFLQKLPKLQLSTGLEQLRPFMQFAKCFLGYFKESNFNPDYFLSKITSDLMDTPQNMSFWSSKAINLPQLFPDYSAAIENLLVDQIPVIPSASSELGLSAAGEICLLTLVKLSSPSKPRNYEITAIASVAAEILRNILAIREFYLI